MDTWYWALEYVRVFFAYVMILFVWPSVVFRDYLRGRSRTVRFAFCVTVPVVLLNTVVLSLGVFHILYGWLIAVLFYGTLLLGLLRWHPVRREQIKKISRLFLGTYGIRLLLLRLRNRVKDGIGHVHAQFRQSIRGRRCVYLMLGVVVCFGMVYFSYGAFHDYSYGFGDMYRHHSWIYGLLNGTPFYEGIYPEAMHCFIYAMRVLFGVKIYSSQLFLAGIHVAVFLVSAYLLLKELFAWDGTAVLALALFLTVDLLCIDEIFSMSRLQWTLPQEFGLYTQFLCALFLLRCLKTDFSDRSGSRRERIRKFLTDENLLLFLLSLAASLAIHFYVTMMAFFLCVVIAACRLPALFQKRRFVSLVKAVCLGVLIAVLPMGIAYAKGVPFQGSIGWAVNVINGTDTAEGRTSQAEQILEQTQTSSEQTSKEQTWSGERMTESGETTETAVQPTEQSHGGNGQIPDGGIADAGQNSAPKQSAGNHMLAMAERMAASFAGKAQLVWKYGYVQLYRENRAEWIVFFSGLALILWAVYRMAAGIIAGLLKKGRDSKKIQQLFDGYPVLVGISVLLMIVYAAPFLGLPELIAGSRLCSTEQLFILAVVVIPVDLAAGAIALTPGRRVLPLALAAGVAVIYVGTRQLGIFHGYLYYELTRYNAAVMVTQDITDKFPENSYTIVSTTDELYQVIEQGRHEELLTFLNRVNGSGYTLPTEYIFVYVEKRPIQYAQSHFFIGPDWLAEEKYTSYYTTYFSEGNSINASEISREQAEKEMMTFSKLSQTYSNLDSRTILESKAYEWCRKFEASYPQEMKVYYEDENFCCYMIRQNTYRLYQLEES